MNYEERVREIVTKKLKERVQNITDSSIGEDHNVFIVQTNRRELVFRFPIRKNTNSLKVQNSIYLKCALKGIKVPKPILISKDYMVETRIPGKDFKHCNISFEDKRKVLFNLAKDLRKLHSIKLSKYGKINLRGIGSSKMWKDYYGNIFENNIQNLEKHKLLSKKNLSLVKEYYLKNKYLMTFSDPSLVHFDIGKHNFMVCNKKYAGIIDFADSVSGDPMSDFARLNTFYSKKFLAQSIYKGYGKIDQKRIDFYSVCILLRHIYKFTVQSYEKGTKERKTRIMMEIINESRS